MLFWFSESRLKISGVIAPSKNSSVEIAGALTLLDKRVLYLMLSAC